MDIKLFHSPGACSMAPYISLLEAGAQFDVEIINLRKNAQLEADYATINPKQKVPYLMVGEKGLSENVAIQCWIADSFPKANLLPENQWDRMRAISYMGWFGSGIHPHITRHFKTGKFCEVADAEQDIKAKAEGMLRDQLALVDRELEGREWFFDHLTVCDNYFFWVFDRALREGFDLSEMKNCFAHNDRMRKRASVQAVIAHKAS